MAAGARTRCWARWSRRGPAGAVRHDRADRRFKTLHEQGEKATERRMRMRKEAIGLRKAGGPGLPGVLEDNTQVAGEADPLFIVMEWIEGRTLDQVVGGKQMTVDRALDYAQQLTRLVLRCHGADVLHRDIKPSNIVVDEAGTLRLVDFGIAWLPEDDRPNGDDATDTDQELGNRFLRLYELAGGHERADQRSDVTFVVGVLSYMLTGRKPLKLGHGGEAAPPHVAYRDAFPAATLADPRFRRIERIFDVGFQMAPNARFRTAAELLVRIEQAIEDAPPPSDHQAVLDEFDDFMKRPSEQARHAPLLQLREAAAFFQRTLYALGEERHVVVMMNPMPQQHGDAWESPIRFQHATLGFVISAAHTVRLEGAEVVCSAGLEGEFAEYYRDLAADIKGLRDAVSQQAARLLAAALCRYMKQQNLLDDLFE